MGRWRFRGSACCLWQRCLLHGRPRQNVRPCLEPRIAHRRAVQGRSRNRDHPARVRSDLPPYRDRAQDREAAARQKRVILPHAVPLAWTLNPSPQLTLLSPRLRVRLCSTRMDVEPFPATPSRTKSTEASEKSPHSCCSRMSHPTGANLRSAHGGRPTRRTRSANRGSPCKERKPGATLMFGMVRSRSW